MKIMKPIIGCVAIFFWCANLWGSDKFAADDPRNESTLKLTFLGTGAPRPSLERFGSSILVEAGNHRLIVDAGSGMRERLFEAGGFDLMTTVDHVLVTHLHFDHIISIPELWLTGWLYGRRVPLNIQGPIGTKDAIAHFRDAFEWDVSYRAIVGVPLAGTELNVSDVSPGVIYDEDGLKITAFEVEHMPIDMKTGKLLGFHGQTFGYRIDYGGYSVVFSGDTRSTQASNLLRFGKDVDVLIHETQIPARGSSKEAQLANVSLSVHSTPTQAGRIFSATKPRMAVYSHIIPPETTAAQLTALTRPVYKGPLTVAHDLMTITLRGDQIEIGERKRSSNDIFENSNVLGVK